MVIGIKRIAARIQIDTVLLGILIATPVTI